MNNKKNQLKILELEANKLYDKIEGLKGEIEAEDAKELILFFQKCEFCFEETTSIYIHVKNEKDYNELIDIVYNYCESHHGEKSIGNNIGLYAGDGGAPYLFYKGRGNEDGKYYILNFLKENDIPIENINIKHFDREEKNYHRLIEKNKTSKYLLQNLIDKIYNK